MAHWRLLATARGRRRRHVDVKPLLFKLRTTAELFFPAVPIEILQAESVKIINCLIDFWTEPERISVKTTKHGHVKDDDQFWVICCMYAHA